MTARLNPSYTRTTPLVTVIIATYNRHQTLQFAIQSVLRQEMQDFEIWVIGDACTDESAAVIASFNDSRVHWKNLTCRCGIQSGPNNEGIKEAKGKYIAYLGHDDLWFPWHLSSLISCLEENAADFAFSLCAILSPDKTKSFFMGALPFDIKNYDNHFTPPSSWLHKKGMTNDIGLWRTDPENLNVMVDQEIWKRIYRGNKKMQFSPSLSVIKFPSPYWTSYSLTKHFPQQFYLSPLVETPRLLQVQLLSEIAINLSRYRLSRRQGLIKRIKTAIRIWGIDLFPFSIFYKRRFQKARRQAFVLRGLGK